MRDWVIDIVRRYVDDRIKFSGESNVSVRCPFHKGGQETRPSFSVNVDKGLYHCFTCHEAGTIPQLLRMLGLPPRQIDKETEHFRDALKASLQELRLKKQKKYVDHNPFRSEYILREDIIAAYNWCPTQLIESGFDPQWLQYLQIGVDRKNQRITYPVRDIYGNLAGFVGGRTNDGQLPKYKVYQGKRKDPLTGAIIPSDYGAWFDEEYPTYQFRSHNYLWNYDKVYPRLFFGKEEQTLIIVEGFKACIWMLQHGYRNTIALMGSSISNHQQTLIQRVDAHILLFLDQDEAGQEATHKIGSTLQKAMPSVRVVPYLNNHHSNLQPDSLEPSWIARCLEHAVPYRQWKKGTANANQCDEARSR